MKRVFFFTINVFLTQLLFGQIEMISPTTTAYAHGGWAVAQYNGTTMMGTYRDNVTPNGESDGAAYLYEWGSLQRTYTKSGTNYDGMRLGTSVDVNNEWVAASAPSYTKGGFPAGAIAGNPITGAVFLGKKQNGQYPASLNYEIINANIDPGFWDFNISLSGNRIAIGSMNNNKVFIYQYSSSSDSWNHVSTISHPQSQSAEDFGYDVKLEGNQLIVGAPNRSPAGAIYIYEDLGNNNWVATYTNYASVAGINVVNGARFGEFVDISTDRAIVSATHYSDGFVTILAKTNNSWGVVYTDDSIVPSGVTIDGNQAAAGTSSSFDFVKTYVTWYANNWQAYGHEYYNPQQNASINNFSSSYGRGIDLHGSQLAMGGWVYNVPGIFSVGAVYLQNFFGTAGFRASDVDASDKQVAVVYPSVSSKNFVSISSEYDIIEVYAVNMMRSEKKLNVDGEVIDVSSLDAGMYQIVVVTEGGRSTSSFIKN